MSTSKNYRNNQSIVGFPFRTEICKSKINKISSRGHVPFRVGESLHPFLRDLYGGVFVGCVIDGEITEQGNRCRCGLLSRRLLTVVSVRDGSVMRPLGFLTARTLGTRLRYQVVNIQKH